MKTLNEQYRLIKEDKGHKGMFLTEAKRQFPNYIRNAATFDEAEKVLKQKGVITENFSGLEPINSPFSTKVQEPFESAFAKFLEEAKSPEIKAKEVKAKTLKSQEDDEKAELKTTSKQVEDDLKHGYDNVDDKNIDNLIFGQVMTGYYAEMKDPKNADKTMEQLKDIVLKNLAKDPIFYTKDGQFGVKGVGYTTEAPGLGTPKEAKGKYKASGYGDLKEGQVDMNKSYPKIHNTGTKIEYKGKTGEIAGNFMVGGEEFASYKVKFDDGTTDEISTADENIKFLEESLEEQKIRRAIRAIVSEELNSEAIGKNYPDEISGEYEGKSVLFPGADLYNLLKDTLEIAISEDDFVNKIAYALTDETSTLLPQDEHKLRTWYEKNNGASIDEAHQLVNINTANIKGGGGKRFVPTKFAFPDMIRKRFGDHIVFSNGTLYISAILFNNLIKGYANQPAIKKLLMDVPMPIKQMLNKTENYGSTVELPKQYKIYHPFKATVEKATEDKFNKAGDKQYWSAGDLLIPNLMAGAGAEKVEESKLRNVISSIIRQELTENVDKRLKEIDTEAAMEAMGSKMEKIMAEIEKRQMQLGKLDEDEDLKAMMDKKATGKIQKEIKLLEKAKAKVEKIMGKGKGKKVEVIDELEDLDELAEKPDLGLEEAKKKPWS
jgi:hypothetical protein